MAGDAAAVCLAFRIRIPYWYLQSLNPSFLLRGFNPDRQSKTSIIAARISFSFKASMLLQVNTES